MAQWCLVLYAFVEYFLCRRSNCTKLQIMNSFRQETWWWEGTVAARKIIIAMIGVFGGDMNDMQVHMTLMFVVVVILITSQVRPFGGKKHGILHILEMASLMAIFLTLWAGSVFNTRPKCQDPLKDEGSTLLWCDALSITVGLIDVFVLAVIVFCFVYMKVTSKASEDAPLVNAVIQKNVDNAEQRGVFVSKHDTHKENGKGPVCRLSSSQGVEMTQRQNVKSTTAEMKSNDFLGTDDTETLVAVSNPMSKMGGKRGGKMRSAEGLSVQDDVQTKRLSENRALVVDSNGVEWRVLVDPITKNNYFAQVNDNSQVTWIDPTAPLVWARATFNFDGAEKDDLNFKEGDLIQVIHIEEHSSTHWWKGKLNGGGVLGSFPSNHCQLIFSLSAEPGKIKTGMAKFEFASDEVGEISFQAGDAIEVISMDGEWWEGRCVKGGGVFGLFPSNRVEVD